MESAIEKKSSFYPNWIRISLAHTARVRFHSSTNCWVDRKGLIYVPLLRLLTNNVLIVSVRYAECLSERKTLWN